jgi:hypothetical protein
MLMSLGKDVISGVKQKPTAPAMGGVQDGTKTRRSVNVTMASGARTVPRGSVMKGMKETNARDVLMVDSVKPVR